MKKLAWSVGIVIVLIIVFNLCTFTVDETEQALVTQYGKVVKVTTDPGLYLKIPFVQVVEHLENRVLSYDIQPRKLITADQRRLRVNNFAIWRIEDPEKFKMSLATRMSTAQTRIDDIVYSNLRNVLAEYEFTQIASEEREEMLDRVGRDSEEKLSEYGIELIDIQVKRADLPEENEEAVYERMKSERDREAALLRAEGQEEAKEITSNADRESRVLVSEAEQEAAALRGEGEAQAMEIYSEAHSQDSEFYEFWKTLESYEESFKPGTSTLLLSPESRYMEFFEQGHNATAGESSSE